jgi:hypothetical protein
MKTTVKFRVLQVTDVRKSNSVLQTGNVYSGQLTESGNIIWTDSGSNQDWIFYPGEYEIIK